MENKPKQEPEKVTFRILFKFWLPPKQLGYSDYLINFVLFHESTYNLCDNLDFIKTRIKDTVLMSFRNYLQMSLNFFLTKNLKP